LTISILMPVYNGEKFLVEAIQSVIYQTEQDWELIAVDDGSTDETGRVLAWFAENEPRVRVLTRPHEGIVAALNAGLAICSGELVARMDADDRCAPERLARQKTFMQANPNIGLVASRVLYDGDEKEFRGFSLFVDWTNTLLDPSDIYLNRFVESPLVHPSVCFRKSLVLECGGYRDGPFPEDYELWLRMMQAGIRLAKLPEDLLWWRERAGRLTRVDDRYQVDAFYACKTEYLARWLKRKGITHVMIWGAGRTSRKRSELLLDKGFQIVAYIDIDPRKIGQLIDRRPVMAMADLPVPGKCFVLSYVASRGARMAIETFLHKRGYQVGKHYLMSA